MDKITYKNLQVIKDKNLISDIKKSENTLWGGDVETFLDSLDNKEIFDLIVTSPPYNIGKSYESKIRLNEYIEWQRRIISKIIIRLKKSGSICWQIGNYVDKGSIIPIDIILFPIFNDLGLKLRNRIIWHFEHGLHCSKRFSGRYETILWFTKTDDYIFNLDNVRIPQKYPGKKYFKGPKVGQYSCNPLGKNPRDLWIIPNVKNNHIERTEHPCQFPVELSERLILGLTDEKGLVFDPFSGSGSTGVAAIIHNRYFWGAEKIEKYIDISEKRINDAINGNAVYRLGKPLMNSTKNKLDFSKKENELCKFF